MNHTFGGSPMSTPCSSTFRARGIASLSANTVFLSILPSPLVSSRTLTRLRGSFESRPDVSGRNVSISSTHNRPSASKSIRIGDSIIGSEATSSTRNPGGMEKVCISSSGVNATDFSICFFAGGQMFPGTLAVPCAAITTARPTMPVATRGKTKRVRFMISVNTTGKRDLLFLSSRHQSNNHSRGRGRQPETRARPGGVLEQYIKKAIRARRDGTNAAELLEHDLLMGYLSSGDFKAPQLLSSQRRDKQVVLPAWVPRTGIKPDAARRDRGRVVDDRLLHAFVAALGDPVLPPHRDHTPAVVLALL